MALAVASVQRAAAPQEHMVGRRAVAQPGRAALMQHAGRWLNIGIGIRALLGAPGLRLVLGGTPQ